VIPFCLLPNSTITTTTTTITTTTTTTTTTATLSPPSFFFFLHIPLSIYTIYLGPCDDVIEGIGVFGEGEEVSTNGGEVGRGGEDGLDGF